MEATNNKIFEVGKFYLLRTLPVCPGRPIKFTPHLVIRKTKNKIVFESLVKSFDGKVRKCQDSFRLYHASDGAESVQCAGIWSMVPLITPDKPCEKPSCWDAIGDSKK